MEVIMRKRFSLSSWMAAGMLALGVGGFLGHNVKAADYYDARTNLAPGIYGNVAPTGENLKISVTPSPGSEGDPGMVRSEDLYQFTGTNFTLGTDGGTTVIGWKTTFGERGKGDDVTMNIVGGTNIFDNQGIYIGSRASSSDGLGGNTVLNIQNGTNVFTQRVIVGGEGQGANGVAGKSTVNISNGLNVFTYNKKFDGSQIVTLGNQKKYQVSDLTGEYKKYLGNGHYQGDGGRPEFGYADVNEYNYYNNYYGVFFSAISAKGTAGDSELKQNTLGADLNISGGKNIFNVVTYVGGGYDLNPYGSINTSSDDEDVVWGGTNNVNISGGFTNFAARTYFGAAASNTTVNFSGRSTTYLSGTQITEDMDRALATMVLDVEGSVSRYENSYNGGDLPYVFFGGKDLTQLDATLSKNANVPAGKTSTTVVNINGFNKNMTTVDFQTTAFFGGADERWLAGDQYYIDENGNLAHTFIYGREDQEASSGAIQYGDNATRKDTGVATLNLNSGKMRIGYVNTTEIVKERNKDNWNYTGVDGIDNGMVYEPISYQQRYEQVRLIGAATGSTFNAGDARIEFETVVHAEQRPIIDAAVASGYSGFFNDMPDTVTVGENEYLTLETGMIAFDKINLSANTDITIGGIGNIMVRSEMVPEEGQPIPVITGQNEFYTNAVFVDTTGASYINDTTVDLSKDVIGTDSTFARTNYEKWFYTIKLEDVNSEYAATEGIETNQVRLHVITKDLDEALVGNMERNSDTFKEVLLKGNDPNNPSTYNPAVYDAIEQIISTSETAEEAAANFDQLIGTAYGNMAAAQVRRMSNFNTMLADQIIASDVCLKNLRKNSYMGNCGSNCGGQSCGQCDACGNCRNWTAWGHFYADGGKVDMHKYIDGYETDTYGAMFAIDWTNCESCHFGVFFNYADTNLESSAPMGYTNIESENYGIGLYAKWLGLCCTGGYGQLIASVNWTDMESSRELYLDDTFAGETSGILPSVFYERGWIFFPNDKLSINPYFGLQYVYYHSEDFSEDGFDEVGDRSALALNVGEIDHHSLRTLVGLRVSRDWMLGFNHDRRLTTRFKGAWMHDVLGECDPTFSTNHAGNPNFPVWNVRANNAGRDWAILGFGVDFNATERIAFLVDYNAFVNEHTTIHAGMATMRFTF